MSYSCAMNCPWHLSLALLDLAPAGKAVAMTCCGRASQWRHALALGVTGGPEVYGAAVTACAEATAWQKALEVLERMSLDELSAQASSSQVMVYPAFLGTRAHGSGSRSWRWIF